MASSPTLAASLDNVEGVIEAVSEISALATPVLDGPIEIFTLAGIKASVRDSNGRVHFYELEALPSDSKEQAQRGRFIIRHHIRIHGYYAVVQDAISAGKNSYRLFIEEMEAVHNAIRSSSTIFGTPENIQEAERDGSVVDRTPVMKGDVLCWHAAIDVFIEAVEEKVF